MRRARSSTRRQRHRRNGPRVNQGFAFAIANLNVDTTTSSPELPILKNWRAFAAGVHADETVELPLWVDRPFVAEIRGECGPYWFLNLVSIRDEIGFVRRGIMLRCHVAADLQSLNSSLETNTESYHGGTLFDEIAALTSLFLEVRVRAGGLEREWKPGSDPMGRPIGWDHKPEPVLHMRSNRPVLPVACGNPDLGELKKLNQILALNFPQSIALVRAARFYQDALWLAESEPNLAWLMLVSAIESVACCWDTANADNVSKLKVGDPKLHALLAGQNDEKFLADVARILAPTMKATKKFIDFGLQFLPKPPEQRPEQFLQIEWTAVNWEKILRKVYGYRSKALHAGVPFPSPMGAPPFQHGSRIPAEIGSIGLAAHHLGGSWNAADLPVNLNLFTMVTRRMILAWLESLQPSSPTPSASTS